MAKKRLKDLVASADRFIVTAEYVPLPGHNLANFEKFLTGYAQKKNELPGDVVLAGVTIPQSPGGVATMSPADIYSVLDKKNLWDDLDVIPHVTAKDHNADAIKTYLIGLQKLGLESVLALTGDKPAESKGVFEVDSIGLIQLLAEMNYEAFEKAKGSEFDKVPQFFVSAAVSPFKYTEGSLLQQYYRMIKKYRVGAECFMTQVGWDWRKSEELFRFMKEEKLHAPVLGNVYFLTTMTPAPRLMYEGKLPGCVVTKELFDKLTSETFEQHLERAAQQVAMYRDLGAAGIDLGGLFDFDMLVTIMKRAGQIGKNWRDYRDNLSFAPKGGYYLYHEDGSRRAAIKPSATLNKRTFGIFHNMLFEPGKGIHNPVKKMLGLSKGLREGKGALYKLFFGGFEKPMKTMLFSCEECGDCFLYENFSLCSMGRCEKGLANAPCGDANPDGTCGNNPDIRCVGELIYEAAASEGTAGLTKLAQTINPPRDAKLEGASSILNYFFNRDHARKVGLVQVGEGLNASFAKVGQALQQLQALGPGAYEKPSGPLRFIISLINGQAKHRADYIAVNVDALAPENSTAGGELMRRLVRLVRQYGQGVPVCLDSKDGGLLQAGLDEWYGEGSDQERRACLVRPLRSGALDAVLPLRQKYSFKVVCSLVDDGAAGKNGGLRASDLLSRARILAGTAVNKYGFKAEDLFLEIPVLPLAADKPATPDTPGYTYACFEAMRQIRSDALLKGVHTLLAITDSANDLPGRKLGVCRAFVTAAMKQGMNAAMLNVMQDYGLVEPAEDLLALVECFAGQNGSAAAGQKAAAAMEEFCRANRKASR